MIRTAFEVTAEDIKNLGSTSMVRLLEYLLLAEARLTGIPLADINIPLQITIADGGEDARITWQQGMDRTDFLPRRFTSFQSKATKVTAASLKRECWEPKTGTAKRPAVLRPVMKSVIDAKGAYIVFTHAPLTPQKIDELRAAILAGIQEAGGDASEISIDIYDRNTIARWTNTHPSVAAWVLEAVHGRSMGPFQVLSSWSQQLDFQSVPWADDDKPRFTLLNAPIAANEGRDPDRPTLTFGLLRARLVEHLASPRAMVRIAGASGLGKTRLAHALVSQRDTLRDELLANAVLFTDFTVHGEDVLRATEALVQSGREVILVVDECPDSSHAKLAEIAARTDGHLRLITIDVETRQTSSSRQMSISVEPAKNELIDKIISACANELSHADHDFIRQLADGFPRMAVRAVEALREQRDPLRSVDDLVDRILWGPASPDDEAKRALSVGSLFQVVEVTGNGETDLSVIAPALAEQTETRMREHLERFKLRGVVVEAGRFFQVQPIPLASHLGRQRLKVLGAARIGAFFKAAPSKVKERFLARLKLFDTSPEAKALTRELLKKEGVGNLADLNTEFGSEALHALVHVDPDAAMATLDRVLSSLSIDELKLIGPGRRHIVWALDKLVFRRVTFDKAARLLLRLGAAENERWSNNASGQFKQLFQLMLSGTETEPEMRLRVLDDGLRSNDQRVRGLCVDALGEMLSTFSYTRSGGAEAIGTQRPLHDWRPTLVRDQWQFFREAISRLTELAISAGPHAQKSKLLLAQSIRSMLNVLPFDDLAAMVRRVVKEDGFWIEGLRGLNEWLYFDRKGAPADIATKVRALHDELMPTEVVDRAMLYASGWDTEFHDPDVNYDDDARPDFYYASRMAERVAEEIGADAGLVEQCLDRMTTATLHGGYGFGKRLAESVPDPVALFNGALARAETITFLDDQRFLCGVLAGLEGRNPTEARACLSQALTVPSLSRHRTRLLGALSTQSEDIDRIVDLLSNNEISVGRTVELSWGKGLDALPAARVVPLLEELERHGSEGMWAVLEIVHMYLHNRKDLPPELAAILKRILLSPTLVQSVTHRTRDGHTFEQEYSRLKRHGYVDAAFARSMTKQVIHVHLVEDATVRYELRDYVRKVTADLISARPLAVWDEIALALDRAGEDRPWRIRDVFDPERDNPSQAGPLFAVPQDQVLQWVREGPSERASFVAGWLPLITQVDGRREWHPSLLSFLDEFGEQEGVLGAVGVRLHPGSWWGSVVPHLEPWLALLEQLAGHRLPQVREWSEKTARHHRAWIEIERGRDAEQALGIF